jgi:plastocyanin
MTRIIVSSLIVAALSAVLFLVPASAMTHPKLTGTAGKNDAFVITLKNASRTLVKTLKAGTYTFVIHDDSTLHSFALDGPHGFAKDFTTIPFKGTKTATLTLKKGKYKYYCKAHESTMFHFFTVK